VAACAALVCAATPSIAFDNPTQATPGVTFYLSVPLDAPRNAKENTLAAGFAIQGRREYERVGIDSRMINHFLGGGIEAKWIVAGVVAAGAVAVVATKDKSTARSYAEQQQQQQAQLEQRQPGEPCPVKPAC
jgi:hypothetical protein